MKNNIARLLLLAVIVAGIVLAFIYRDQFDAAALEQWVRDAGEMHPSGREAVERGHMSNYILTWKAG